MGNCVVCMCSTYQLFGSVGIQLSFTLLNTDPSSLHTQWNIEQAVDGKHLIYNVFALFRLVVIVVPILIV